MVPAQVQAAERVVYDVFGSGPVAEHDMRQPGQAQHMGLVDPRDGLGSRIRAFTGMTAGHGQPGALAVQASGPGSVRIHRHGSPQSRPIYLTDADRAVTLLGTS